MDGFNTIKSHLKQLEAKKSKLLKEEEDMKIQIAGLEQSLLSELASSEGDILENKALIDSLNKTKKQALVISDALVKSKQIGQDLDNQRDVYRPIARAGSNLFFTIDQLKAVNNMYQYSLTSFLQLFRANLETKVAGDPNDLKKRIRTLCRSLLVSTVEYVLSSLFKADRLMFGMHIVHGMFKRQFQKGEWEFFTGEMVMPTGLDIESLPGWTNQLSKRQKATFAHLLS
eukprot:417670-Amorphochlora_amoeboformis.AAC.1